MARIVEKAVNEGYLMGAACAYYALQKKGTQAAGLSAATISFLAGRAIFTCIYNRGNWGINKSSLYKSLEIAAGGIVAYLAVTSLCSGWSIRNALLITALGIAGSGIEKWERSLNKIDSSPGTMMHQVLASGLVLTAACGLKHFGLIK